MILFWYEYVYYVEYVYRIKGENDMLIFFFKFGDGSTFCGKFGGTNRFGSAPIFKANLV